MHQSIPTRSAGTAPTDDKVTGFKNANAMTHE